MENTNEWLNQMHLLSRGLMRPRSFLRVAGIVFVIEIIALAFGIAFFIITSSLWLGLRWFSLYWQPAYFLLFIKLADIRDIPPELSKPDLPWYRIIILLIKAAIVLGIFYLGVNILIKQGFCGQSLICLTIQNQQ